MIKADIWQQEGRMTGKQYFIRVANAIKSLEALQKRVSELKECATTIGSFDYSKEKVQTSPQNYQEEKVVKILDSIREYDSQISVYADLILEAEKRLSSLSKKQYSEVIRMKYLENERLSWDEIGDRMKYTGIGARDIHKKALTEFEERFLKK